MDLLSSFFKESTAAGCCPEEKKDEESNVSNISFLIYPGSCVYKIGKIIGRENSLQAASGFQIW
jgi:hypothetical protein